MVYIILETSCKMASNSKKQVNSFLSDNMFLLFLVSHGATSHMRAGSGKEENFCNDQLWTSVVLKIVVTC